MRLVVIGAGHVGLVSAACLAAKGHEVICVDSNAGLVEQLKSGRPHVYEPGLEELLRDTLRAGYLLVQGELESALLGAAMVMVAVGTPSVNGAIELRFVREVAREIGRYLQLHGGYLSVVVKSSVIPGTTAEVVRSEIETTSGKKFPDFGLGMNPEFLREGKAVADFMEPDRIVLGYEDERTLELLEELYSPWSVEKLRVNTRTAELIKYANNALLATQVSTMNEIANLAVAVGGIDIMDVVKGVQTDRRWNPIVEGQRVAPGILNYLVPGCGFGGSCLPKDVEALRSQGVELGLPMPVLNAVLDVNRRQPFQVVEAIERESCKVGGRTVLLLGLAFKEGTDDVRESASLKIVQSLLAKGARVLAHDPMATNNFQAALGQQSSPITFVPEWQSHVQAAEVIIVATRWAEYLELEEVDLTGKVLFDARRLLDPSRIRAGKYLSIGRRK